jgi:hypothetical protein
MKPLPLLVFTRAALSTRARTKSNFFSSVQFLADDEGGFLPGAQG